MPHPSQAMRRLAGLIGALALLLALALPQTLFAADLAVVKAIAEGEDGSWRKVDMSAGTVCVRDGVSTPLRPGFQFEEGDRIQTNRARVELNMGDGITLMVQEASDITLGLRRIEQAKGGVFYTADAPFEISVGKVLVAIEGTRFLVEGFEEVIVAVDNGQVRVTAKDEPVLIAPGERVEISQGHIPGGVRAMTMGVRRDTWDGTWLTGEPPLRAGLILGGGLVGGAGASARLQVGLELPAHLEAIVDLGVGVPFGRGGILAPVGLGIAYELGPISAGAQFVTAFDSYTNDCGGKYSALHFGGVALAQTGLPLTRRLSLVGALRAGWVAQPLVDLGVGVEMGF